MLTPVAPESSPIVNGVTLAFVIVFMTLSLDPVATTGCTVATMTVKPEPSPHSSFGRGARVLAGGALIAAVAASLCCILPVTLFSLGISGAWISNFTQLAPYKPIFITATLGFAGTGYWLVYRASLRACAESEACARPLPNRLVTVILVAATVIVIAAFGFDYLAPYLLS
jgi:mercuric ion transport protein